MDFKENYQPSAIKIDEQEASMIKNNQTPSDFKPNLDISKFAIDSSNNKVTNFQLSNDKYDQ